MATNDSTSETPQKTCRKCGIGKPATLEYFEKWRNTCRKCRNEYTAQLKQQPHHKEAHKLQERERRKRPEVKEQERKRNQKPERIAWKQAYMHDYCRTEEYKEWDSERKKKARAEGKYLDRERIQKRNYSKTPQRIEYNRRYWKSESGKAVRREVAARRRANQHDTKINFTKEDWQRALEYWEHKCAICSRPADFWLDIVADHWIPITKGGDTTSDNIVPLCQGKKGQPDGVISCNPSKSNRDAKEWLVEKYGVRKANQIIKRINSYFEWVDNQ